MLRESGSASLGKGVARALHPPNQWEALQFYHPSLHRSVIFCFRARTAEKRKTLRVRGLCADHVYQVGHEDANKTYQATGQALSREEVTVGFPEMNSSEIIWIEKA